MPKSLVLYSTGEKTKGDDKLFFGRNSLSEVGVFLLDDGTDLLKQLVESFWRHACIFLE